MSKLTKGGAHTLPSRHSFARVCTATCLQVLKYMAASMTAHLDHYPSHSACLSHEPTPLPQLPEHCGLLHAKCHRGARCSCSDTRSKTNKRSHEFIQKSS